MPRVKGPGVTIGRSGASFGKVTFVAEDFWPHNAALFVKDFKGNEPAFIRYLLEGLDFSSLNSGSAQQSLNRNFVYGVQVPAMDASDQRRIAAILGAYDDLISNNLRRIGILEEMARVIYREWFVHFRFPGHEGAGRVESPLGPIPTGWLVKRLGEIVDLQYGKALKQQDRREGDVLVFGSSGVVGSHDTPLVSGPGLILGRKGNVGSLHWSDQDFWPIDTVYYVVSRLPLRFLYHDLQRKNFLNSDAAVPGLSRRQAYSLQTVVPPDVVLESFGQIVDPLGALISNLKGQAKILRATRDLLLPRLMSGRLTLREAGEAIPASP